MKTQKLQLVKCKTNGHIGILGSETVVQKGWLIGQKKPFAKDAIFHSMYPITRGAVIVDLNNIKYLGEPTVEQIDEVLGNGKYCFNPASDAVLKLIEDLI